MVLKQWRDTCKILHTIQTHAAALEEWIQIHPTYLYTRRELYNLTASFLYSHSALLVSMDLSNPPFPSHEKFSCAVACWEEIDTQTVEINVSWVSSHVGDLITSFETNTDWKCTEPLQVHLSWRENVVWCIIYHFLVSSWKDTLCLKCCLLFCWWCAMCVYQQHNVALKQTTNMNKNTS